MLNKKVVFALAICVIIAFMPIRVFCQPVSLSVPLKLSTFLDSFPVCFGIDSRATRCTDVELGEWFPLSECMEIGCVVANFLDPRGVEEENCFRQEMLHDLRPYDSPQQIDTFLLRIAVIGDTLLTMTWSSDLNQCFDSLIFFDITHSPPQYKVDMLSINHFEFPKSRHAYEIYIIARGPKIKTDVPFYKQEIPEAITLQQNYPNPFNPSTKIAYSLSGSQHVRLIVYDVFGREVAKLMDALKPPGSYEAEWKAENLSSGIYFYRLQTGEKFSVKKMLLTR
jgi:hypothetical protein